MPRAMDDLGLPIEILQLCGHGCRERDIVAQVNRVAPAFQKGFKDLAKSPIVGEVPNHLKFCT
jgi:hypothetical protein